MIIDTIGTQSKIAKMIVEAGADYLLEVKNNQGKLYQDLEMLFSSDQKQGFLNQDNDHAKNVTKGHGRIDIRECWTISDPEHLAFIRNAQKLTSLKSFAMIVRRQVVDGVETVKTRFFISNLDPIAQKILSASRKH